MRFAAVFIGAIVLTLAVSIDPVGSKLLREAGHLSAASGPPAVLLAGQLRHAQLRLETALVPAYEAKKRYERLEERHGALRAEHEALEAKYDRLKKSRGVSGQDSGHEASGIESREPQAEREGGASEPEAGHPEEDTHHGYLFTIGMFAVIVILAVTFGMAATANETIRINTWSAIDNVTAIFIAVLFFQLYCGVIGVPGATGADEALLELPGRYAVAAAVLHACLLLCVAFWISWRMRRSRENLAIFCGILAHYVSFASMHSFTFFIRTYFSATLVSLFVGISIACLFVALLLVAVELGRRAAGMEDDEWQEKADDLCNDFGAMAIACAWTLLVRAAIAGEYHHLSHEEGEEAEHTAWERAQMLVYAALLTPVAALSVYKMSECKHDLMQRGQLSYWMSRVVMFASSFLCMSVAWAWIFWGEWSFDARNGVHSAPPIQSKFYFAVIATAVCASSLIVFGAVTTRRPTSVIHRAFRHQRFVALAALSLVVGWSWEECFDVAIETMTEDSQHPLAVKFGLTVALASVIVPVYAIYLKPAVFEAESSMAKGDEELS